METALRSCQREAGRKGRAERWGEREREDRERTWQISVLIFEKIKQV